MDKYIINIMAALINMALDKTIMTTGYGCWTMAAAYGGVDMDSLWIGQYTLDVAAARWFSN